ncbi:von Hippel-Lindau disease tumor suppressor-like isoform X2 [Stylophora pistillata]|nr:von Hippel-Lindau disease tumor suppressor-like isoform X2 [Stylophora pistillata]
MTTSCSADQNNYGTHFQNTRCLQKTCGLECPVFNCSSSLILFPMDEREEGVSERPLKSLHNRIESPVLFVNHTGRRVNLKWFDYSGEEKLFATIVGGTNNRLKMNTYVTHPWIAVDEETNERLLLNFRETFFPDEPVIQRVDFDARRFYVVRAEINITTPVYRLEEYCTRFLRKTVLSQNIRKLPLPQSILKEILQKVS